MISGKRMTIDSDAIQSDVLNLCPSLEITGRHSRTAISPARKHPATNSNTFASDLKLEINKFMGHRWGEKNQHPASVCIDQASGEPGGGCERQQIVAPLQPPIQKQQRNGVNHHQRRARESGLR